MIISNENMKESQEYLHKMFSYDGKNLIWKVRKTNSVKIGDIAKSVDGKGYIHVSIDGKRYKAHRLIWMFVYGYMPENQIDHINRVRDDNRIENLREVSQSCNTQNSGIRSDNTSGIKGIYWHKKRNNWAARITVNGKRKNLGGFKNKVDAAKARYEAELKYDWASCETGDSSAKQFIDAQVL